MTSFNEVGPVSEPEKPKKCPCQCRIIIAVTIAVLIAGAVCCHVHRPKPNRLQTTDLVPGKQCVVYFRRDALGLSTTASPRVTTVNSTDLTLGGKMIAINREAVLLERVNETRTRNGVPQPEQLWIPRESILFIVCIDP